MKLKHSREELKHKTQEMRSTAAQYEKDKSLLNRMEKHVANLKVGDGWRDGWMVWIGYIRRDCIMVFLVPASLLV